MDASDTGMSLAEEFRVKKGDSPAGVSNGFPAGDSHGAPVGRVTVLPAVG